MTRKTPLDAYKQIYLLLGPSETCSFDWAVDLVNEAGSGLRDIIKLLISL